MKNLFTHKEKIGFFSILFVSLLIIIVTHFYPYFQDEKNWIDKEMISKKLDSINALYKKEKQTYKNKEKQTTNRPRKKLFAFDPNTISTQEWRKLGFSEKQAQSIQNYKTKGGKFFKKEDVKKLYVVSDKKYEELESYIAIKLIKNIKKEAKVYKKEAKVYEKYTIELNTVDSLRLLKLRGIGPVFTHRILKYRKILGGFHNVEQLNEVYGIKTSTVEKIKEFITIDLLKIKKIKINTVKRDSLPRHPYLKFYQWKAILNYKNLHGKYFECNDLLKLKIINQEQINKICSYLQF